MKNMKLVVASLVVLAIWLAVSPAPAQADTLTYRIDWTLTSFTSGRGDALIGLPAPTYFTVDSNTYHFTNGFLVVSTTGGPMWTPIFGCDYCSSNVFYAFNNLAFYDAEYRKNFLASYLAGGTWVFGTSASGFSSSFEMNGYRFTAAAGGNNGYDGARGTFTTTLVPESSSLSLLCFGLSGVAFVRLRKNPDVNFRLGSETRPARLKIWL